jgi:hypothetical protein
MREESSASVTWVNPVFDVVTGLGDCETHALQRITTTNVEKTEIMGIEFCIFFLKCLLREEQI